MDFEPTHMLKPGCGYWETTNYPLGGCFRRAGQEEIPVKMVTDSQFVKGYGHLAEFVTADGKKLFSGHYKEIATT